MSFPFKRVAFLLPGLLGLAAGCGGSNLVLPSEGVAAKIVVVSGDKQAGVVGVPLVASLVVRVTDQGEGFEPEAVADPLAPENILKSSGRGIFFMRSFMDDVQLTRVPEGGMEVQMVKKLAAGA